MEIMLSSHNELLSDWARILPSLDPEGTSISPVHRKLTLGIPLYDRRPPDGRSRIDGSIPWQMYAGTRYSGGFRTTSSSLPRGDQLTVVEFLPGWARVLLI